MRWQSAITTAVILLTALDVSFSNTSHPTDTTAVLLDSFRVNIAAQLDAISNGSDFDLSATGGQAEIEHIIMVWATQRGVELVGCVDATRAVVIGSGGEPAPPIVFAALSDAAVDSAIAGGRVSPEQDTLIVYQPLTVHETVADDIITYTACSEQFAVRTYALNWGGGPLPSLVSESLCTALPPPGCYCLGAQ